MASAPASRRRRRLARLEQQAAQALREAQLREAGVAPLVACWEARYATGGTSGPGSAGEAARVKARYVNELIRREEVASVVDWGCGDGQQLARMRLPDAYLGIDVAPSAVAQCLQRHPGRAFLVWPANGPHIEVRADLALSLDVVFHLVTDADFEAYWSRLFASAERLALVHGTDHDGRGARHVRHHRITDHTPAGWELIDRAAEPDMPGFYLWRRG